MATRDNVYWKFGITAEAAQLLETSLGTLLLTVQGLKQGWPTAPQAEGATAALERIEKSTLGKLLRDVQDVANLEGDLPALFDSALKTRNRLFHGFYELHNFKIDTDEGRDEMIADLEVMHTELFEAWRIADAMVSTTVMHVDDIMDFDSLDNDRLEQIRRSIETAPGIVAGPRLTALVAKHWPWLSEKLMPMEPH